MIKINKLQIVILDNYQKSQSILFVLKDAEHLAIPLPGKVLGLAAITVCGPYVKTRTIPQPDRPGPRATHDA